MTRQSGRSLETAGWRPGFCRGLPGRFTWGLCRRVMHICSCLASPESESLGIVRRPKQKNHNVLFLKTIGFWSNFCQPDENLVLAGFGGLDSGVDHKVIHRNCGQTGFLLEKQLVILTRPERGLRQVIRHAIEHPKA